MSSGVLQLKAYREGTCKCRCWTCKDFVLSRGVTATDGCCINLLDLFPNANMGAYDPGCPGDVDHPSGPVIISGPAETVGQYFEFYAPLGLTLDDDILINGDGRINVPCDETAVAGFGYVFGLFKLPATVIIVDTRRSISGASGLLCWREVQPP